MHDRIAKRKLLEGIASALSEPRLFDVAYLLGAFDTERTSQFAISLHEFVYIMRRARISGFDAGVMTRLQWLSRNTFPHTPELVPFADLWTATFVRDRPVGPDVDSPTRNSQITTDAIVTALEKISDAEPQSFRMPHPCLVREVADDMRGVNDLADGFSHNYECRDSPECSPGNALSRFLSTMDLAMPTLPPALWERLKYPRRGLWQASFGDENDAYDFVIDPAERDHFTLSVDPALTGPPGALDINLSFALGPTRCTWLFATSPDFFDDIAFMARWNDMMEKFQVVVDTSSELARKLPSHALGSRQSIVWRHIDVRSPEDYEEFDYFGRAKTSQDVRPRDKLEIIDPKTGEVSIPDSGNSQQALESFLAACEELSVAERTESALSAADREAFLSRWSDRPEIQAWTDEQILRGIAGGM